MLVYLFTYAAVERVEVMSIPSNVAWVIRSMSDVFVTMRYTNGCFALVYFTLCLRKRENRISESVLMLFTQNYQNQSSLCLTKLQLVKVSWFLMTQRGCL